MNHQRTRTLVAAGLFAAAIATTTAYLLHIPIPTGGYIHVGDALIYLAASLLPLPWAIGAAVVGAGLADLLTAPMWVLPTLIIKALVVLSFTRRKDKILCTQNYVALGIAAILSPAAYALAACLMAGTMAAFTPQFLGTLVQAGGSTVLYLALASALDRTPVKTTLFPVHL